MSKSVSKLKLKTEQLRWRCPEDIFKFKTTEEVEPLKTIIGQPRAIEAIKMGAEINATGYNIFVTGLTGTGRTSAVEQILKEVKGNSDRKVELNDFCYVNNFIEEDQPCLLRLEKGKGRKFAQEMDDTIQFLRSRLPKYFEEDVFQTGRKKIIDIYQDKEKQLLDEFDKKIKPYGFIRGQLESETGAVQPEVFPVIDDEPVRMDELDDLLKEKKVTKEQVEVLKEKYQEFHEEIYHLARKGMKLMQEFRRELAENDKKAAKSIVASAFDDIVTHFDTFSVRVYIRGVKNYILDNLRLFVPQANQLPQFASTDQPKIDDDYFSIFKVNVILDNSETEKAPVIIETTPSYSNLFGTIEKSVDKRGFLNTDFTKIRSGSLLKADQGYLIVNANDLFSEPAVWPALKRVLLYRRLEIQPFDSYLQMSHSSMKPEKIKVNVKVIIIGGQTLYDMLYHYEKGFKKIFKVNARFDDYTHLNDELLQNYASFIAKVCENEGLIPCSPSGVAAIIEWAVQNAGAQNKITLRFSDVADILRESAFYDTNHNNTIEREDVALAIKQRRFRNNLIDEKIKDNILENSIMIDTEGEKVGQINGLTVYDSGNYAFGKPAKITVAVSAGNSGIINVEREADMSGKIHNKGVLIISGFLREKFGRKKPLSLSASIAFEQSYGGIDGDSASAAEIYAILSAVSEVPINQAIAITGSCNQKGEIQPIGGVNEKIRGFYEVCKAKGLKKDQGVIIPVQNIKDLMLDDELIEDVKKGNFNIYSFSNIEEGVELLFGMSAGTMSKTGKYPSNSLYGKVISVLDEFYEESKKRYKEK